MESLINPLQDKIEDWKKTANQLDKDHAKGRFSFQNSHIKNYESDTLQFNLSLKYLFKIQAGKVVDRMAMTSNVRLGYFAEASKKGPSFWSISWLHHYRYLLLANPRSYVLISTS